jgi:hypothetical protein
MLERYNPIPKLPENSKSGVTVKLEQKDTEQPFEATVYFKKSGRTADELRDKDAINFTMSGKLRLDIGEKGYVEVFSEQTQQLKDAATGTKEDE